MDKQETSAGVIADVRDLAEHRDWNNHTRQSNRERMSDIADRLEAANKRETDSIHRAMVILAGIEMPDPDYPPKLWTALEDAYNALSDALGTDGDTTADEEEAKANGRHFVIQPCGNATKLREALKHVLDAIKNISRTHNSDLPPDVQAALGDMSYTVSTALFVKAPCE